MLDQDTRRSAPAIVALPGEIDLTNVGRAYDRLYAAFASGAPVVIADFTATSFCDCFALRRLVSVRDRAVARGAGLRLVIPASGPVRRLAALMGLDRQLPVYPSAREAAAGGPAEHPGPPGPPRPAEGAAAMTGITGLTRASHLHILRWRARLGELRRSGGPAPVPGLAGTWDTVACLIDLDMRAEEEICGPAVYGAGAWGGSLARLAKDAHDDLREVIGETSLQTPGSPLWWDLAAAALSSWACLCDQEEHALPAGARAGADLALGGQLARQWRAFREACIRDRYPDAPPHLPTCRLRQSRPATPRLADPAFTPLACTCQDCTRKLATGPAPWRS